MKEAKELHNRAMSLYEDSLAAKFKGQSEERIKLLTEALVLEKQAAEYFKERIDLEPTRSTLYASCATMAWQLANYRESEKLVALGLAGEPTEEVLEELRDLFDKVNFHRHLTTKGIVLSENEFRFTLGSGNEMMKGIARGHDVMTRIAGIEALYSRTVQRMHRKPYKSGGRPSEEENNLIQLYYKTPEAASFAIIFKIPETMEYGQQKLYPEHSNVSPYLDEMLTCVELVNTGDMQTLKTRINDEEYFQSFVINTRKIAPDGTDIKQVGFTVYRDNKEIIQPLQKVQSEISLDIVSIADTEKTEIEDEQKREKIVVDGKLLASDSTKKNIVVMEEIRQFKKDRTPKKSKFKRHKINFVTEAQRELVRDNYEENVLVEVWKYADGSLEFIDLK